MTNRDPSGKTSCAHLPEAGYLTVFYENGVVAGHLIHWPDEQLLQYRNHHTGDVTEISTAP